MAVTPNRPDETHDPILRGPRSLEPSRGRRSAAPQRAIDVAEQKALDFGEVPLPRAPRPLRAQARRRKLAGRSTLVILLVLAAITGSLAGLTLIYSVNLPQISDLERYRPSTTTDLYDRNGKLIGSFALQRRQVVDYDGFAPVLRQAVISIEDKNFESHWGINVFRVAGAAWHDIRSHGRAQGASTLTMQLARNLFLSDERTAGRKVQEAFLAIQIERTFTKQQIFTLYGNQIYLGSGNYGFEAASEYFFSKHAKDLNLPEAALLAGLPKGPVGFSPILNPDRALKRRNLVISEMEADGKITHAQAQDARSAPLGLHLTQPQDTVAPWFQEEVRRELEKQFGSDQVHEAGLRVDTTLDMNLQQTADHAIEDGVAAYERRHGWKGKLENVVAEGQSLENYSHPDWAVAYGGGDYVHAMVTRVLPLEIMARIGPVGKENDAVVLMPEDWKWTGERFGTDLVKPGDVIYVRLTGASDGTSRRATLEQDSGAQGALMAVDNTTGDVLAMVGGRDYELSVFNRATQAERQVGSSFKPYVYTAAIEDGVKPTDIVMDTPVSFGSYTPHNYENDFKGAMTVANAFAESRNIPALRLAARVGIHNVIDLAHKFGVTSNIPPYLPVALGAAEITLEEQVASYSVFPNDGLRVTPRLIRKVSNADGIALWSDNPSVTQVIDQQTARTMMTLLEGVTQHGTGASAKQLNHPIGGKTGTTSDFTDAWFLGFSPSVTCGVWVGFDSRQSLGKKETGAQAALPIWMTFMKQAIAGKDDEKFPDGGESTPVGNPDRARTKEADQALTANRQAGLPIATPRPAGTAVQPHAAAPAGTVSPGALPTSAVPTTAVPIRPAPGITNTAPVASRVKNAIAPPPVAKPISGGAMRSLPAPAARSAPAQAPVARNLESQQLRPIRAHQPVVPVRSTFPPAMLRAMQQAPAGAHVFHYLPAGKGPRTVVVVPHPPRFRSTARVAAQKPRSKSLGLTGSQGALVKPAMPQSHSATQSNGSVHTALN
ncbi:MAG TPA: PBP1A family penicillin-binding protein [Terracidiphilus sp.]|nr:PBP1A family penicillin-binding protein [Terracidiphilus sp.]